MEKHGFTYEDVEMALLKTLKRLDLLGPVGVQDETGRMIGTHAHFKLASYEVFIKLRPILDREEFDDDYSPKNGRDS